MMLDGKKVYFQYGYHSILCFYSCKIKAIVFFDEYSRFEMVDKSWVKNKMDVHKSNGQCADERASSTPSFPSRFAIPLYSYSSYIESDPVHVVLKVGKFLDTYSFECSENYKSFKLKITQPDSERRHRPNFRTVFGIMIGPFSSCEIGTT